MQIKGLSMYSSTAKPATKGEYPSNCYEVGLTDVDIVKTENDTEEYWLVDYITEHSKEIDIKDEDGNTIGEQSMFKIKNSRFEIPMFDMNALTGCQRQLHCQMAHQLHLNLLNSIVINTIKIIL